ncbi:unnamed protein product [Bursaphelenchus xylophilus]|uniref:(pine wood nematode) hypothetical protein n=1 Tax=Bursaphelenchus xylophilus TaxID=6326 RepID=A0A1I7SDA2_BURXY|nr:unnamed protein product [Bursaphelenchus xylophilus]CAG9130556.1 unnamed protein product [Bursaphelenchus xylophilus]
MSGLDECDVETYNNLFTCPEDEIDFFSNDEFRNNVDLAPSDVDILNDYKWDQKFTPESSDSGNYSPGSSNDDVSKYDVETHFFASSAIRDNDVYSPFSSSSHCQASPENNYITMPSPQPQNFQTQLPIKTVPLNTVMLATPVTLVPATRLVVATPISSSSVQLSNSNIIANAVKSGDAENGFIKKIEDKRLRNRAAAQASRYRKRMELDNMKQQLTEYEAECNRLKEENKFLKERVRELEEERELFSNRKSYNVPHKKAKKVAGVCLAFCALLFTLNNGYTDSPPVSTELQLATSSDLIFLKEHHGRSLPQVSYNHYNASTSANSTICTYTSLNTTEKLRLNRDLNGWIKRHEQLNLVELRKGVDPFLIYNSPKSLVFKNVTQIRNHTDNKEDILKKRIQSRRKVMKKRTDETDTSAFLPSVLNITRNGYDVRNSLMDKLKRAIKREDDVLYLVMMREYFLFPTLNANFTQPPKLTIVIPALTQQEAGLELKMLQIDTQVVGTGLFQLSKDIVSLLNQSDTP